MPSFSSVAAIWLTMDILMWLSCRPCSAIQITLLWWLCLSSFCRQSNAKRGVSRRLIDLLSYGRLSRGGTRPCCYFESMIFAAISVLGGPVAALGQIMIQFGWGRLDVVTVWYFKCRRRNWRCYTARIPMVVLLLWLLRQLRPCLRGIFQLV